MHIAVKIPRSKCPTNGYVINATVKNGDGHLFANRPRISNTKILPATLPKLAKRLRASRLEIHPARPFDFLFAGKLV